MFNRIVVIVLDSVGIGALPDAEKYGDGGANTLGNIARFTGGLFLPTLEKLGLGNIEPIGGVNRQLIPIASFGKMMEISKGKDTTSGHWELAGCPLFQPFPVYPHGFPPEIIARFEKLTGKKILGNKPASGTEIIAELGEEHMRTGKLIVYTSADSVFQIAAHEAVISLDELYEICRIARNNVCVGDHAVGRVIARPFIGQPGNFVRTSNRHDFSLEPPAPTVLDLVKKAGLSVIGIGKIGDIFAGRGLTKTMTTKSNDHGMEILSEIIMHNPEKSLIMLNLVEFDSLYGHRNNSAGYKQALERFDSQLAELIAKLSDTDLLIVTADHGCDPTIGGTDHTREYVPLLVYCHNIGGRNLGVRETFADVAATVAECFDLPSLPYGRSFIKEITEVR